MTPETMVVSMSEEMAACNRFQLYVFWIEEHGDRDELCRDLAARLKGSGILPLVLRKRLFVDPNEWAADAISLLVENQSEVQAMQDRILADRPLALAVIAKSKLTVSQSSSPATAPTWIPKYGGTEILTVTRDMDLTAACTLSSPEGAVSSICSLLYELEVSLHKLAATLLGKDKHHGQELWSSTLKSRCGLNTRAEFLGAWDEGIKATSDAGSYRPSLRSGWSMVAAMWATFLESSPAQLLSKSDHFGMFFEMTSGWIPNKPGTPILPILFRGTNDREASATAVAARGVVLTVGLACQLSTAAAHADQYGRVNASVLTSVSRELRTVLAAANQAARSTSSRNG